MPRTPILPAIDRQKIYNSGKTYSDWIAETETRDQGERISRGRVEIALPQAALPVLTSLIRAVRIIAIAEPWCGDVIRHTPLLMNMVAASAGKADIRFLARGDYPDFFARFLTNGGEAIPKYVFCTQAFVEVGNWGPMSSTPRRYIAVGKATDDTAAARKLVQHFYDSDNRRESTAELLELFRIAGQETVPQLNNS